MAKFSPYKTYMESVKSSFFHILELAAVLVIAYLVQRFFNISNETITGLVVLVLGGLAKVARETGVVSDFVNPEK